jgi:GxxExxY protein
MMGNNRINYISGIIVEKAIKVHKTLGPGLLESAYHACLRFELLKDELEVFSEKPVPIIYEEVKLNHGYRIDMLVDNQVVVELKAIEELLPVHTAQMLTYLKLGNYELGLIINFHVTNLTKGIRRIANFRNYTSN